MTLPFQPRAIFGNQLQASAAISLLAEALYVAHLAVYGGEAASWQSLDYETRWNYIQFAKDMLAQLNLEVSRDDSPRAS